MTLLLLFSHPASGTPPPADTRDTHDGWLSDNEIKALRANEKRLRAARKHREEERERERRQLVTAVETAFNRVYGPPEEAQPTEATQTAPAAATAPTERQKPPAPYTPDWESMAADLTEVRRVIALIEAESKAAWLAAREAMQDEEDVMVVLLAA